MSPLLHLVVLLVIGSAGLFCITVALCLAARYIEDLLNGYDDHRND